MTRYAVAVHIIKVSTTISHMPIAPCTCGSDDEVELSASGLVPMPASFEKMPRETPRRNARKNIAVILPDTAAFGVRASVTMFFVIVNTF